MAEAAGTIIIGGGLGGAHAAIALRERGYRAPVTVISDETAYPYDRTKLSKEYLQGKLSRDELLLKPCTWWAENDIDVRLDTRVHRIDRAQRQLVLEGDLRLDYDWLVLATGANSRTIELAGAELPGVYLLRTVEESDALREALAPGSRLAIIGAGWIGLEVAASAAEAGASVTVIAPDEVPLASVMGAEIGELFADLHQRHGVDLRMETGATAIFERDGRAGGVRTPNDDIESDAVLVAIGAQLRTELAEEAGLAVERGVLADATLRTSDDSILAVGDIANAENTRVGERLRREHWDTAIRHGTLAADTILGGGETFDWLPYFYTDQYDLGMEYVGMGRASDDVVIRGSVTTDDGATGAFIVFWLRDGVVTAAMNVNIWDVNEQLRDLVGARIPAEALRDTSIALDALARQYD